MATVSFSTAFISDVVERLTLTNNTGERRDVLASSLGVYARVGYFANVNITNPHTISSGSSLGGIFADLPPTLIYSSLRSDSPGERTVYDTPTPISASILFRNSSGTTLTSYLASELTRTIDADGYCVLSNFPPKTPVTAGTISDILFRADTGSIRTITLTVGAPAGPADVQFDDRILVTNQPWRLDGSIKFRVPMSYEYTT
jgi:hypothetical protein